MGSNSKSVEIMMNYVKTTFLVIVLAAILIWIGSLLGGPRGAMIAFIVALVINGVSYWYSDRIVLRMYKARELMRGDHPGLFRVVEELSGRAGIPCPRIYMADIDAPNAFATGRDPENAALCLTRGTLELLGDDELKGVISHELAHIRNRDTLIMTVTAALASAVMMLAYMARWAAILGGFSRDRRGSGNFIGILAVSILAPFAALLVQLAISRSREYAADATGARMTKDPAGLARALENLSRFSEQRRFNAAPQTAHLFIVQPLRGGFLANLFSTHPPVEERIKRLRSMA
ncbi:MAG: zinc metalloprotease HtpX [Candidatus Omnitrophota bacterium]|nr:zinc metalloprotease HtpX [Candidatus Omnitrophota bacterium]